MVMCFGKSIKALLCLFIGFSIVSVIHLQDAHATNSKLRKKAKIKKFVKKATYKNRKLSRKKVRNKKFSKKRSYKYSAKRRHLKKRLRLQRKKMVQKQLRLAQKKRLASKRRKPASLKGHQIPALGRWQLQLLSKKEQIRYVMFMRLAMIRMEKAQLRHEARNNRSHDNAFLEMIKDLLSGSDAYAEDWGYRTPGNSCIYAGWPGKYVKREGWDRPYCVKETSFDWSNIQSTYGENVQCGENQMLCNPLIFGLGSQGNGYCVQAGRRAFSSCQSAYSSDEQSNEYSAQKIAEMLIEKGKYDEILSFNQTVTSYCNGENSQSGTCTAVKARTAAVIEKGTAIRAAATTDGDGLVVSTEDEDDDVTTSAKPPEIEVITLEPIDPNRTTPVAPIRDDNTVTADAASPPGGDDVVTTMAAKRKILVLGDSHLTAGGSQIGLGTTLAEGLTGLGHEVDIKGSPGSAPRHWCSGNHNGLFSRHEWDGTSYSSQSGPYNSSRAGGNISDAIGASDTVVIELGDNLLGASKRADGAARVKAEFECLVAAIRNHPRNSEIQCMFVTPTGWGKPSEATQNIINGIKEAAGDRCSVIDSTALLPEFNRPDIGDVHLPPRRYQTWGQKLVTTIQESIDLFNRQHMTPAQTVAACTTNCPGQDN